MKTKGAFDAEDIRLSVTSRKSISVENLLVTLTMILSVSSQINPFIFLSNAFS